MEMLPKSVTINENGPREGFQIEKTIVPTDRKVELINALSQTGLREIQITSFVNPKRVPNMADADEVVRRVEMRPGVRYTATYLNAKGLERAAATKRLTLDAMVNVCASPAFLARNQNATPEKAIEQAREMIRMFLAAGVEITQGSVNAAFGCNFQGEVPVSQLMKAVGDVFNLTDEFGIKLKSFSLSDTMAWATPDKIRRAIDALRTAHPDLSLALHLHDTRGMAIANAYAGLQMGVADFDGSIGGLGGCPFAEHKGAAGNLCTEDFAFMCEEMGIETGLNLEKLIEAAHLAEEIVGHPLPGSVMQGGLLSKLRGAKRAAM
jgi:hydroxymethylglutaryl-CoA lyase